MYSVDTLETGLRGIRDITGNISRFLLIIFTEEREILGVFRTFA